jgi:hypothetical protein
MYPCWVAYSKKLYLAIPSSFTVPGAYPVAIGAHKVTLVDFPHKGIHVDTPPHKIAYGGQLLGTGPVIEVHAATGVLPATIHARFSFKVRYDAD